MATLLLILKSALLHIRDTKKTYVGVSFTRWLL